jgi:hypothetical protein
MAAARAAGWVPPPSGNPPPSPPGSPASPPTPPRSRLPRHDSRAPAETASCRSAHVQAAGHAHELRENEPSSPFHKAADAPGALAAATAALKAAQPRPGLLVRAASNLHHVKESVHVEELLELDEVAPHPHPHPDPMSLTLTLASSPLPPHPRLRSLTDPPTPNPPRRAIWRRHG